MLRQQLIAGAAAALLLAGGVAAALADPPPPTTTGDTTTVSTTATTASTTDEATTTEPTTTIAATTAVASTATTARVSGAASVRALSAARPCTVGAAILLEPKHHPAAIEPVGDAGLAYPSDGSIFTASSVTLHQASSCTEGGEAALRDITLFGDDITIAQVALHVAEPHSTSVTRLAVAGKAVPAKSSSRVPLHSWGVVDTRPSVRTADGIRMVAALSVELRRAHAGLPAGTTILVAAARVPKSASPRGRKRRRALHQPLKVTPRLGERHYTFPVVGGSEYIDTYGAFRSDVPGGWHHGDDIFAALGTPVVAVASGTINRVGWEKLGGWRLWVRDGVGDEFYYAHLSGYTRADLRSKRVRAGQVIGFIGNTGDAITTSPHLHFEIHPRRLLHLGYDGAVDPTTYLNRWTHVRRVAVPLPAHPPLPSAPFLRSEARRVFRELLVARHLIRHGPRPALPPAVLPLRRNLAVGAAPQLASSAASDDTAIVVAVLAGLGTVAVFGLGYVIQRRARAK
jgi:murein DD-endopeptidase MepM/ murein hydrolase activator NlpD